MLNVIEICAFSFLSAGLLSAVAYVVSLYKFGAKTQFVVRAITCTFILIASLLFASGVAYNGAFIAFMSIGIFCALLAFCSFGLKNVFLAKSRQFNLLGLSLLLVAIVLNFLACLFVYRINLAMVGLSIGLTGIIIGISSKMKLHFGKLLFPVVILILGLCLLFSQSLYMFIYVEEKLVTGIIFCAVLLLMISAITFSIQNFSAGSSHKSHKGIVGATFCLAQVVFTLSMFFII